jgi:polyisoprenoid-binding protein YceI
MSLQRTFFSAGFSLVLSLGVLGLALPTAFTPAVAPTAADASGSYAIDAGHTFVTFSTTHLGVSYAYGRFNEVAGSFKLDEKKPENCEIRVVIQAASIDTNSSGRDKHLTGPDFFNAKQFPEVVFESKKVSLVEDGIYKVEGELTAHGVTQPLTVEAELVGQGERGQRFGFRAGFRTGFTFKRTDFDMGYMVDKGMLGDDVEVVVSVEGARK